MFPRPPDRATQSDLLASMLRSIRRRRGWSVRQAARAMAMSMRSYERFEAGDGEIRLERLFRFANLTDSDPLAIVAGLYLADPNLAVRCADHKLTLIHAMALKRFHGQVGEDLGQLDVVTLIGAFTATFEKLASSLGDRRAAAETWLSAESAPSRTAEDEDLP